MSANPAPQGAASSKALAYVQSKGWSYKESGGDQITLEYCPLCNKDNHHFYMNVSASNKDGLWDCKVGGHSGNLWKLMESQGDRMEGVQSMQDWASGEKKREPAPNAEAAHRALMNDPEALDYLVGERGLSLEAIEKYKLGVMTRWFKDVGEVKALFIPFFHNGQLVWGKFRSLPPSEKAFDNLHGWDAPLYNQEIIKHGLTELFIVEGEMDALTLMSHGIENVVAVPGANTAKTQWITLIDAVRPEKIYILYDRDKVGQKAAHELATKLGIDRCLNLTLPEFDHPSEEGKQGKDINEWFRAGNDLEGFEILKKQARPFDVIGVSSSASALDELEADLEGKEALTPTFDTPWPSLNKKLGGAEPGDVIDIIAQAKIGKTTMAMDWADHIVEKYGVNGMIYCLEMPTKRMVRKWVSYKTQTDDSPAVDIEQAKAKAEAMKLAIKKSREIIAARQGDLMFAYTSPQTADDAFATMEQAIRRYNLKWIVFDNLQLLCDVTLKNANHRTIHLSQISKKFKALATKYGVVIIRIVQPNRVGEGQIVDARNADGSSQIEKDCDASIALHRNQKAKLRAEDFEAAGGFIDEEMAFEPQMLTRVCLSRYAPGGVTTLMIEGATSTVTEFDKSKVDAQMAAAMPPKEAHIAAAVAAGAPLVEA